MRITRAAHGFTTNDVVTVTDFSGVPGANGTFTITVIDANSFDLVGSAFSSVYLNTGWASVSQNLAPAISPDVKVQFVTIADYAELTTEITAGCGQSVAGQGLGVNVLSTIAPSVTPVGGQARDTSGALPVLAATGYSANPTAVTAARGVDLLATLIGALVNKPFSIPEADWQYAAAAGGIVNTTDVALKAAAAASMRAIGIMCNFQNTSGFAALANDELGHLGIEAFGWLIMQPTAGGVTLEAARTAIGYGYGPGTGARFVSLPTPHTRHVATREGRSPAFLETSFSVPENGRVLDPVPAIMELCAAGDVVFDCSHVSGHEAVALVEEARRRGCTRIRTHCARYAPEEITAIVAADGFAEFSFFVLTHATQIGLTQRHASPAASAKRVIACGRPSRCTGMSLRLICASRVRRWQRVKG